MKKHVKQVLTKEKLFWLYLYKKRTLRQEALLEIEPFIMIKCSNQENNASVLYKPNNMTQKYIKTKDYKDLARL